MALRQEIKKYTFGDVEGSYQVDTGMGPGEENYVVVDLPGEEELVRTFYFEEDSRHHCRNFVRKLAEDESYRRRCLEGETTWAKVQDAYSEASTKVFGAFEPLSSKEWEDQYEQANELARSHCEQLYERLSDLYEEVSDPSPETVETVVQDAVTEAEAAAQALRDRRASAVEPVSVHHEIEFGKHQGKTLLKIAAEHTGYAEWAAEELDNRPEIRKGFEKALQQVEEEDL